MSFRNLKWKLAQFFELKWWLFYFKGKEKVAYLNWKKNYWKSVFKQTEIHESIQPSDTILELGCGPAGCFIYFTQNKIVAVDPLLQSYQNSLSFFEPSEYPNTQFISSSIEKASIQKQFDVILCFNAINHVKDIELSLNKLCKWLKPEGKVFLSVDAHNHSFLKTVFHAIPGDILHPHQYTLQEYVELCSNAGLKHSETILLKKESIFSHYLLLLKH